ncbi:hypothetical protein PIB30_074449 [Stylosanthes scabra]|uniref:Uncharacterized protein n=1 Tax=Stylosanthes scabra TaxID=79078 RepID=A0ABU6QRY6_9FABA|nr:hypothetical protein [Stylosanthes scabra]
MVNKNQSHQQRYQPPPQRQQPLQPQQPPMDDFRLFLQEQRVYQKQQATQMANLTEILAGLVTQNINNTPTSSQPSSSSGIPSQPLQNSKGSINAISFHEDSLEHKVTDDDEEEFLKMLEEISTKDDAKESIRSKGFMKKNQEGRIVASGVASRLHKHQQKLPTQQESCPRNKWSCARSFLMPAKLLAQEMMVHTLEVEFQVFGPRPRPFEAQIHSI